MPIEKQSYKNFIYRGSSYKDGMLLLLAHLSDEDWKLGAKFPARLHLIEKNIVRIYEDYVQCLDEGNSFNENKQHFDDLLKKYNDILCQHTTLKKPFQSLLLAERCSVWKKGREDVETPVFFASEERDCVLMQCETAAVDSEMLLSEYAKIETDTPPFWFQHLASWQQDFIKTHWQELCAKSIPSSLRSVPGIANLLQHDFSINNEKSLSYFRHATPLPIDLLKQEDVDGQRFDLTCLNFASQIRLSLDEKLKASNASELNEVVILTQSLLSPGKIATFKSQHLSDSSDNDTQIYEMKEQAVERFQQALQYPLKDKDFLAKYGFSVKEDNGSLLYKEHPLKKVTLLSTNHPFNILRRFGVHPKQTERNDRNTLLLLGAVGRYLSPIYSKKIATHPEYQFGHFKDLLEKLVHCAEKVDLSDEKVSLSDEKKDLNKTLKVLLSDQLRREFDPNTLRLFDALQTLLQIPSGQGSFEINDQRHRQSLVAAMEAIISNCIGATLWVACKSGKDRTGGASAAYDAAATFYELRGRHPRYADTASDRALYLQLYKDLFESGHHQKVASQNAPGANGLVKPPLFLPGDMQLDAQHVQLETQLARLNKPKRAYKRSSVELFDHRLLEQALQEIKQRIEKTGRSDSNILLDWNRGLESENYFILGKSIKELRNGEAFKSEADLLSFIETQLLNKIQDDHVKEYYLALFLSTFHQGGFTHVFEGLGAQFANNIRLQSGSFFLSGDKKINFSPLTDGIQIEEIVTCDKGFKEFNGEAEEIPLEKAGYHYQAYSCISVTLNQGKDGNYQLATTINQVAVDCENEELRPQFFNKTDLLRSIIAFLDKLMLALKHHLTSLVASKPTKAAFQDEGGLEDPASKPKVDNTLAPMAKEPLISTVLTEGSHELGPTVQPKPKALKSSFFKPKTEDEKPSSQHVEDTPQPTHARNV